MGLGKLKTPQSLLFLTKNQWRGWGWGGCWNKHCLGCCKPLRVPETLVLTVCAFLFFAPGGGWNLEFLTPPFLLISLF